MSENPYQSPTADPAPTGAPEAVHPFRHLRRIVSKLCLWSLLLHAACWFAALLIEPFRFVYFGSQTMVLCLLELVGISAHGSIGFVLIILPIVAAVIHTILIGVGGLVGGRLALRVGSNNATIGAVAGAIVVFAVIVVISLPLAVIRRSQNRVSTSARVVPAECPVCSR